MIHFSRAAACCLSALALSLAACGPRLRAVGYLAPELAQMLAAPPELQPTLLALYDKGKIPVGQTYSEHWNCEIFAQPAAKAHCEAAYDALAAHPDGTAALAELDQVAAASRLQREVWYAHSLSALVRYGRGEIDLAANEVHLATPRGLAGNFDDLDDNRRFSITHNYTNAFFESSAFGVVDSYIKARGGRFLGDYDPGSDGFTKLGYVQDQLRATARRCPRPDPRPGVTPEDGKRPQILEPGKGIRGLVLGQSTPTDVLRTYGCDASIIEGPSHEVVAINYSYHQPGQDWSFSMVRSPQYDRPQDFLFSHGVLVRIGLDRAQKNVRFPNGFRLGSAPMADQFLAAFGEGCIVVPVDGTKETFAGLTSRSVEWRDPKSGVSAVLQEGRLYVQGLWIWAPGAAPPPPGAPPRARGGEP